MYDVILTNGQVPQYIHDHRPQGVEKLPSASFVNAVNSISSLSFDIFPNNSGYDVLQPFATLVKVYNTKTSAYDFVGRVLQITPEMESDGVLRKSVICEDRLGYLHDSVQPFAEIRYYEGDETRNGLQEFIDLILANHNDQVTEDKRIYRGNVTVTSFETTDGVYKALNWEDTWDIITGKLLASYGGYILLRESNGLLYLDYLADVGTTRNTKIELGRNMQSVSQQNDPSGVVTRLVPLGAKLTAVDAEGNATETEERLTIEDVNDGKTYIESPTYKEKYGIIYATQVWDDVTESSNLKSKAEAWLDENNGIMLSHDIAVLNLYLLGMDIDDFKLYDRYPAVNPLIGLNDTLQIVKKSTNVVEPQRSSFVMGDSKRLLSDSLIDYDKNIQGIFGEIDEVEKTVSQNQQTIYTYVETNISSLNKTASEMMASIERQSVMQSDYDTFKTTVKNILSMDADGTTMIFQTIYEAIAEVDGNAQSQYNEILKYIRFVDGNIILGEVNNPITLTIQNDRLSFQQNGVEVAYISDSKLYIGEAEIKYGGQFRLGNYAFVPRSDGSLSFLKVGGA